MFLVTSNRTFVTGDDKGCTIVWDAQLKKKLIEVIASFS
jgi:cell cycle arrest protein BUB3